MYQDSYSDCGICCLLSIIRYYGGNVSKEYLREITFTNNNGTSFYHLLTAAQKIGFTGKGVECYLDELNNNELPVIAHIKINNLEHFVVISKIDKNKEQLVVSDPTSGIKTYSFEKFYQLSTNQYLILLPIKKIPNYRQKKIITKIIKKVLYQKKLSIFILSLLSIITISFHLIATYSFQYILDYGINQKVNDNIIIITSFLTILIFTKLVAEYIRNLLLNDFELIIENNLYTETYKQIITLPYLYYRNRPNGEILTRLLDLSEVRTFIFNIVNFLQQDLFIFVFSSILLFLIDIHLGILIFVIGMIIFILNVFYQPKFYHNNLLLKEETAKVNTYLLDSIKGNETIKGLHLEKNFIKNFNSLLDKYQLTIKKLTTKIFTELFLRNNVLEISKVLLLAIGGYLVIEEELSIGRLISFYMITPYVLSAFQSFSNNFLSYYKAKISLNRIRDVYDVKCEEFDYAREYRYAQGSNKIKIENLKYSYNGINNVINNLSLSIKEKEKILLCAGSGFGKSTLIKLILRFLEVPNNKIFINGVDINKFHLDDLRNKITYVSQEEVLFTRSIKENITLNRIISEEELKKVCNITLVDELLKDKKISYEYLLEENGYNLSGGERQRLILARALLNKSEILILDEAFSQIDSYKERKILTGIFEYKKDLTMIVITHRFTNKDLFTKQIFLDRKGVSNGYKKNSSNNNPGNFGNNSRSSISKSNSRTKSNKGSSNRKQSNNNNTSI